MADEIKYISLGNLELFKQLMQGKVDEGDAKAIKTVALSPDQKSLLFYRESEPVKGNPCYSIEIPGQDLSDVMHKLEKMKLL